MLESGARLCYQLVLPGRFLCECGGERGLGESQRSVGKKAQFGTAGGTH